MAIKKNPFLKNEEKEENANIGQNEAVKEEKTEKKVNPKEPKKEAKKASKTAKKEVSVEENSIIDGKEEKRPIKQSTISIDSKLEVEESDEITEEELTELMVNDASKKQEAEEKMFKFLNQHAKKGTVLLGEIYGVEPLPNLNQFIVAVMYNGEKISIPDSEFFEPDYNFEETQSRYFALSEKEKLNVRMKVARYYIGAKVYFCIKKVVKQKLSDEYEGTSEIITMASRKEAMQKRRDLFFLHKENKDSPYNLQPGNIIKNSYVMAVGENRATVECCGVETRLDAYSLTNEYIENCQEYVKPGDRLSLRIKKIIIDGDKVLLTVTGRTKDVPKAIRLMQTKATYEGVVQSYNSKTNKYTITLKNGVGASVKAEDVRGAGDIPLFKGDRVQVLVTKKLPGFVVGIVMKV